MPASKLKRATRDAPVLAKDYNEVVEAAEWAASIDVDGSAGLQISRGLSGPLLSLNLPDGFGFGYTTAAASTSGNVATAGMLRTCAWVQTSATTFTFTYTSTDAAPFITPDPAGMPASKRVWWMRDASSGVLTVIGALCPLTTADPTPAIPPMALVTANGTPITDAQGRQMMTA